MPRDGTKTRAKILSVATRLFYKDGIRNISIDSVVDAAGVTKRTFYYHFRSKDDLIAAYLESRDTPSLELYREWFNSTNGKLPTKIEAIFIQGAETARHPKWRGCGFLRTVSELANKPGHPAIKVGSSHKKRCEAWLAYELALGGCKQFNDLAKQIVLLMDGAYSIALVHHDAEYFLAAGKAAKALVTRSINQ